MHDYKNIIEEAKIKLSEIEGKILWDFFVEIIEPEFNMAYLVFNDSTYAIYGGVGSEVLKISKVEHGHIFNEHRKVVRFKPYSIFINKRLIQARCIGEEWNGHGFEFNFDGIINSTMIIQSIYAGEKPTGFEDCIKLGIGQYYYSSEASQEMDSEYNY